MTKFTVYFGGPFGSAVWCVEAETAVEAVALALDEWNPLPESARSILEISVEPDGITEES